MTWYAALTAITQAPLAHPAREADSQQHWLRLVRKDRIVAVVATGSTVSATLDAIDHLRSQGLPVVMPGLAGDSVTTPDPEALAKLRGGLARLAPSGSDQGAAAATQDPLGQQLAMRVPFQDRGIVIWSLTPPAHTGTSAA